MRGSIANISKYIDEITPYLSNGATLHRACKRAGVPYTTMKDYLVSDGEVRKKIEALQ